MISPCIQPLEAVADYPLKLASASSDSAAAVNSVAAVRCGSAVGACPSMAPADIQPGQHALQHVISPVIQSAPPAQNGSNEAEELQPAKYPHAVSLRHLVVEQEEATDSADDSWTPGQPQSSGENADAADYQEETWDPNGPPPQYCTNCTARMYAAECSDCGHSSERDDALFDCNLCSNSASTPPAAVQTGAPIIIWDDEMLLHEEGKAVPHPERPDRLRAIMARLMGSQLTGRCQRVSARTASRQELLSVHTQEHLQRLQLFCSGTVPAVSIPSDTYINQHTLRCAALAAGSAAEVACRVVRGEAMQGAAIIRPPGHHAESNTAMGFCFFNNAAVAARAAQGAGAERVLILDWDVHHGNGTQHIFESNPSVLYMSLHRYDRGTFYPGTGAADEVGHGRGAGYTVNVPWDAGNIGNGDYMAAMQQVILPIAGEFAPNLIIISAGFDAADGDPIGGCCLTPECFGQMTADLMAIAPTVLLLEGGYNLLSTAVSTEACMKVLLGEQPAQVAARPSAFGWLAIQAAKKSHSRYWSCLAGAFPQLSLQQQLRLVGYNSSRGVRAAYQYGDDYKEVGDSSSEGEEDDQTDDHQDDQDPAVLGQQRQQQWTNTRAAKPADKSLEFTGRQSHDDYTSFRHSHAGHSSASAAAAASSRDTASWQLMRKRRRFVQRGLSRKQQVLRAIHKQAMKCFWRRRMRHSQRLSRQQLVVSGEHQEQQLND